MGCGEYIYTGTVVKNHGAVASPHSQGFAAGVYGRSAGAAGMIDVFNVDHYDEMMFHPCWLEWGEPEARTA